MPNAAETQRPLPGAPPHGELIEGISFAAYQASPGINATGLKAILRSPAHYRQSLLAPSAMTPPQAFGNLLHAAILEPERYARELVVRPPFDLRRKDDKERAAAWAAALPPDAITASQADAERVTAMLAAMRGHNRVRRLLAEGRRECCLYWRDPEHGVDCRGRLDFVAQKTGVIVDVKTCADASPEGFARAAVNMHYSLSAAHYLAGARVTGVADPKRFVFVAVEKEPPYGIGLYTLPPYEHARGAGWRHRAMARYATCLAEDAWPGYSRDFVDLDPPGYAPKAVEAVLPDKWF